MRKISDSEFQMWRAVFAIAHTDGIISKGEIQYMLEVLDELPFSHDQDQVLNDDIKNPKDIVEMFKAIPDEADQLRFFRFAHDMVWADGNYDDMERELMKHLKDNHVPMKLSATEKSRTKDKGIVASFLEFLSGD